MMKRSMPCLKPSVLRRGIASASSQWSHPPGPLGKKGIKSGPRRGGRPARGSAWRPVSGLLRKTGQFSPERPAIWFSNSSCQPHLLSNPIIRVDLIFLPQMCSISMAWLLPCSCDLGPKFSNSLGANNVTCTDSLLCYLEALRHYHVLNKYPEKFFFLQEGKILGLLSNSL